MFRRKKRVNLLLETIQTQHKSKFHPTNQQHNLFVYVFNSSKASPQSSRKSLKQIKFTSPFHSVVLANH